MRGVLAIVAGLVVGLAVGGGILAAVILAGPAPSPSIPTVTPIPTAATQSPSPSTASSSASASPSGSDSASANPSPSSSTATSPSSTAAGAFHVGKPAPALKLPQLGGGEMDLANLRGKPVWVNFMGTYCPPCRDELPLMSGFLARYGEQTGLVVLLVDVKEDEGTVAPFLDSLNVAFPVGLDGGTAQAAWQAFALPEHFWIDKDGIVRYGALGGIGPDVMVQGLKTILPGVDVTP